MIAPREFYQVRVAEVISEAADACSLVLDIPAGLAAAFRYQPGQFLTVRVPVPGGGSVARCYSLSSSPHAGDRPAITVKRMAGGHASNWIADHLRPGSVLDVLPPAGTFTPATLDRDLLLLAAGSGITPVISILKSALVAGRGRVVLIYANRDERSIIFSDQLNRFSVSAAAQITVVHWLDSVQGPPTPAGIAALARPYAGYEAFVCGPDPFMAAVRAGLAQAGLPASRVHVERFLSLAENPFEGRPVDEAGDGGGGGGGPAATLSVTLDGRTSRLTWPAGTRMLDVLIDHGLDPPYSCRQGICGACACLLTGGQVSMAHNEVLEDEDLADGYILACQAVARTAQVTISY